MSRYERAEIKTLRTTVNSRWPPKIFKKNEIFTITFFLFLFDNYSNNEKNPANCQEYSCENSTKSVDIKKSYSPSKFVKNVKICEKM